ncbi:hypothetical protein [Leifsonia sp. Root4]|nr:hypothetical protein [Leifsonia sp. Root4]
MTFDAHDAGTDVNGIRRESLSWGQLGDAAPSRAVTVGDDAA